MPLKTYQDEQPTLNLTPMIDVVFLLIIFFMVGTRFADNERKIELDLPTVGEVSALSAAPQMRVVHVLQD
ncbi:MAG: biopolymer transporter ExbD, partial [Planctomycetota bacterium]